MDCTATFRGYRSVQRIKPVTLNPASLLCVTGDCPSENTIRLEIRWLESCRVHIVTIHFNESGAELITHRVPVGGFDVPDVTAHAEWQ